LSAPLVADLQGWLGEQRAKLARGNDIARAIDYVLKRWTPFTRFLDDGRVCLTNNAAERALRGIAIPGSFCPCRARGRHPLSMASFVRTPAAPALR